MDWFFDGLGTLIVGLLLGGSAGTYGGYRLGIRSTVRQTQKAKGNAHQVQIGGDVTERKKNS